MKKLPLYLISLIIAGAAGIGVFLLAGGFKDIQFIFKESGVMTPSFSTPFSGKIPSDEPPVGAMIDNELLARPFQKGLFAADFVYEAPTEGDITRFLAIFSPEKLPEKIGPIRSARTYFLDWIHEYGGVYAHVGGNSDVLARLREDAPFGRSNPVASLRLGLKEKVFNADQFYLDRYFKRENAGQTPLEHTMFTGAANLKQMIADQNWKWGPPVHLINRKPAPFDANQYLPAGKIIINFGSHTYTVSYEYDAASDLYLRSQAKLPHIDRLNGKQLGAKTVVVQRVKSWSNGDREMSISIKTVSSGEAVVFKKGRATPATWKKESLEGPTRFFDKKTGAEIILADTPVWFEILTETDKLTYEAAAYNIEMAAG